MLNEDRAHVWLAAFLATLAQDLERGQDVVVLSVNFVGFPLVAPLVHRLGETRVLNNLGTHLQIKFNFFI